MNSMQIASQDFLVMNCIFAGNPPKPFAIWKDWFDDCVANRCFSGVYVSDVESARSDLQIDAQGETK